MRKSFNKNLVKSTFSASIILAAFGVASVSVAQTSPVTGSAQNQLQAQAANQAPLGAYPSVVARPVAGPNGTLYSPAIAGNPPDMVQPTQQPKTQTSMPWDNTVQFGMTGKVPEAAPVAQSQATQGVLQPNGQNSQVQYQGQVQGQQQNGQGYQNVQQGNQFNSGTSLGAPQLAVPMMPNLGTTASPPSDDQISRAAFEQIMLKNFNLTPDDIRNIKKEADLRARASAEMPGPPPKPVIRTIDVSLQPGASPEVIRTYVNSSTSLVITDSTGAPWPVVNFDLGNKSAFEVTRLDNPQGGDNGGETGGTIFSINAKQPYGFTNLVLVLKGCPTPVVVALVAGQKEVDYRATIRVLQRGPNARVAFVGLPAQFDASLLTILDGSPPAGGRRLKVDGPESSGTTAWYAGGQIVVRTNLHLISPAPTNYASAEDGTSVYAFAPTSSFRALQDGKFLNLTVSGW